MAGHCPPSAPFAMRQAYQNHMIPRESTLRHETKAAAALSDLASSIGYRLGPNFMTTYQRNRRLVFADVLVVLEMFVVGHRITKRPRELDELIVQRRIEALIPRGRIGRSKVHPNAQIRNILKSTDLMITVTEYIQELEKIKHNKAVKQEAMMRARRLQEQEQAKKSISVEETMEKIDQWCDAWLEGRLSDADWVQMQSCVERKDL